MKEKSRFQKELTACKLYELQVRQQLSRLVQAHRSGFVSFQDFKQRVTQINYWMNYYTQYSQYCTDHLAHLDTERKILTKNTLAATVMLAVLIFVAFSTVTVTGAVTQNLTAPGGTVGLALVTLVVGLAFWLRKSSFEEQF